MESKKEVPKFLYRGMVISYENLRDFVFSGVDMVLPYQPDIDEQGRETVHDGNEYGIYMSDNPKVAEQTYGNATRHGSGTYIDKNLTIGTRKNYVILPDVGVCYKISSENLNVRNPWIQDILQGHYNNGYQGDEWITDKIPVENIELTRVRIGEDILHNEQDVEIDDKEQIKEKVLQILEQRKARLEVFAKEMKKIPEDKRAEFDNTDLEVFKEIYGEDGFRYMKDIEEINTSTSQGMIRYLMANVYKQNTENIDFKTLAKLQNLKDKAKIFEKRNKEFDLKEKLQEELNRLKKEKEKYILDEAQKGKKADTTYFEEKIEIINRMINQVNQKEKNNVEKGIKQSYETRRKKQERKNC